MSWITIENIVIRQMFVPGANVPIELIFKILFIRNVHSRYESLASKSLKCEVVFLCRLDDNRIGEKYFAVLVSYLISNPSHLRELSVSWNKPGDSGVRLLSDLLKDSNCKLEKLQ